MKLHYSPTSPFARKVRVLAIEANLDNMIEYEVTDVWDEASPFRETNPLSKIPVLVTEDGLELFDSPVICAYLDTRHGGQRFIPVAEPAHWRVLRIEAACDGIMDASFQTVMELRNREAEQQSPYWLERYRSAIEAGIAWLDKNKYEFIESGTYAPICAAVALAYVNFRLPSIEWQKDRKVLSEWFEEFSQRPSMKTTEPA